jgi:hypothetical protein
MEPNLAAKKRRVQPLIRAADPSDAFPIAKKSTSLL